MPRRDDLHKILLIGSGPIVIGQAAEFDYSGTQACRVLMEEGYEVVLVNSNPATIMTDPEVATTTYVEPLLAGPVRQVIERERPDALLPTLGGQTALNLAKALFEDGTLERYDVELIGADYDAIERAEDRERFRETMTDAGLRVPRSAIAHTIEDARAAVDEIGLPFIVRPAFTLGGKGGGVVRTIDELARVVGRGLSASPISQVLLEESVLGWGEFELEVMRDRADNVVIVCSIENLDPMGVHTGDSVCVAPQQTLTDRQYQTLRDQAIAAIRAVGVETGGSNVQFAVNRATDEIVVIEMNPRVSRSSALASKATGFPIAKIAARLAVGYTLQEIPNDITRATPASFEPAIDYCVVKWPRFAFEKFPGAEAGLTTHMKSVGEAMAIGRTFKQAFAKALRSRELDSRPRPPQDDEALLTALESGGAERFDHLLDALRRGLPTGELHRRTSIDPWFLRELSELVSEPDAQTDCEGRRTFKSVDTCAAEFAARTPYYYSSYERGGENEVDRGRPAERGDPGLGSEPHRTGDRVRLLLRARRADRARAGPRRGDDQLQPGDRLDRLRHLGPPVLRAADARGRARGVRGRAAGGGRRAVRRADAAQAGRRAERGRRPDSRYERRRDRPGRGPLALRAAARRTRLQGPAVRHRDLDRGGPAPGRAGRFPAARAAELRPRRAGHGDRLQRRRTGRLPRPRGAGAWHDDLPRPFPRGLDRGRRRRDRRRHRRVDRRDHAARRGGRDPFGRLGLRAAAAHPGGGDAHPDQGARPRASPGR